MSRWVTIFVWLLTICQCRPASVETTAQVKTAGGEAQAHGEIYDYLLEQGWKKEMLAVVDPQSLSISFLGAGLETTRIGRFVRLYFYADIQRDYLQILRCDSVAKDYVGCRFGRGLYDTSSGINIKNKTTINTEGQYDCWNKISADCTLLADGKVSTAEAYLDLSAPTERRYFYIARACVVKERVNEMYGTENCSSDIAVSDDIDVPEYILNKEIDAAREKIDKLATRLNAITEKAYHLTIKLSQLLADHEEEMIRNERARRLREGIAMIAGMAIGVAGSIYTMSQMPPHLVLKEAKETAVSKGAAAVAQNVRGYEIPAVMPGPLPDVKLVKPPKTGAIGSGLEAGKALGAAFADIVASVDDYPKTCYACENVRAEIAELVGNVTPEDYGDGVATDVRGQAHGYIYGELLADYAVAINELIRLENQEILKPK